MRTRTTISRSISTWKPVAINLARGPVAEVERAKTILATFKPGRIDLHESASGEKATPLVA
jgi:hypothetical protein